jgi:asparagine synthase (glutamine-hydrolysing)
VETLPYLVKQYEEPFADASQIITYMVSKLARKHVTVIMTGDGGDENFAGYPRFCRFKRDVFLNSYLNTLRPIGIPVTKLLYSTTKSPFWNRMTKFLTKSQLPLADRFVSYNRFFSEEDKINLYTNEFHELTKNINSYDFARNKFSSPNCKDLKDKSLYFEMTAYLPESQLAKVDIATMSASLEARSPFLDQKMVELVAKIPYDLKVSGKCNNKYILKKAVEKLIPKENIYRKKMGFTIPLSKWFTGKLNLYAKSILLSKKSKIKTIIREEEIEKMLMSHKEDNDFGPQLWSLLTLELWFKNYFT